MRNPSEERACYDEDLAFSQASLPRCAWRDGVYSVVRIELKEGGDSTRVVLDHCGFPEEMHEHLSAGWHRMYWEPLKKLLAT